MIAVALTGGCIAACAVLLVAERRDDRRLRAIAKCSAAACFVALGCCASSRAVPPALRLWVQIGLGFGAAGDAALLGRARPWFLAGLGLFLVGHLAYVVGMVPVICAAPPGPVAWLVALPPVIAALVARRWLAPHAGSMRIPVDAYIAIITAMVIAAALIAAGDAIEAPRRALLLVGALAFFASDLAVARDQFVAQAFVNKLWGLPAYFVGQLLIAWAIQ